jgi:hypothetical protein
VEEKIIMNGEREGMSGEMKERVRRSGRGEGENEDGWWK